MRFITAVASMFLPAAALAQEAAGAPAMQGSPLTSMLPLVLIFVVFYFMLIKPQQKRAKEHSAMLGALKKGDQVVTGGGIIGKVVDADKEGISTIEIAPGVEVKISKSSVTALVEKPGSPTTKKKSKIDSVVKNDNVVLKKDQIANDN